MQKSIPLGSWNFETAPMLAIPVRHDGTIGPHDKKAFTKRAGTNLLDRVGKNLQLSSPGTVPVLLLAVGATEFYGPNRNGDGFKRAACISRHDTFRKHARFYRNHQSRDPRKSYGVILLSDYNPDMERIELVAGLNGDKQAAAANGGLLADLEMEKLAAGKEIPVSMGCGISYDICSACGNHARTRADYCTERTCKAGGLKKHMGSLLADGTILHADNWDPDFNDMSHVPRQADRIAFVLGQLKTAAAGGAPVIGGAELAELLTLPADEDSEWSKLAWDLRPLEFAPTCNTLLPCLSGRSDIPSPPQLHDMVKLGQWTAALADAGVVLPVTQFLRLFSTTPYKLAAAVQSRVNTILSDVAYSSDNPYDYVGAVPSAARAWAAKVATQYSLLPSAIMRRNAEAFIRRDQPAALLGEVKVAASDDAAVDVFAQQYGHYMLASLKRIRGITSDFPLTAAAAVQQNRLR